MVDDVDKERKPHDIGKKYEFLSLYKNRDAMANHDANLMPGEHQCIFGPLLSKTSSRPSILRCSAVFRV